MVPQTIGTILGAALVTPWLRQNRPSAGRRRDCRTICFVQSRKYSSARYARWYAADIRVAARVHAPHMMERKATKPGSVVRGTFSPARAWRPFQLDRTTGMNGSKKLVRGIATTLLAPCRRAAAAPDSLVRKTLKNLRRPLAVEPRLRPCAACRGRRPTRPSSGGAVP